MITAMYSGLNGLVAALVSGVLALIVDLVFLEPFMSRARKLWIWKSVDKGYFSFLPKEIDRFTAPPGNYIVWFLFPFLMNSFMVILGLL